MFLIEPTPLYLDFHYNNVVIEVSITQTPLGLGINPSVFMNAKEARKMTTQAQCDHVLANRYKNEPQLKEILSQIERESKAGRSWLFIQEAALNDVIFIKKELKKLGYKVRDQEAYSVRISW